MRRFVLFVLAVAMLFAVVACQDQQKSQCSCGSEHFHSGYGPGTTSTPARSSYMGIITVDGTGDITVSDDDPGHITVVTTAPPCAAIADAGADADADAPDADVDAASDAEVDAEIDAGSDASSDDASVAAPTETVTIELHIPESAQPEDTFDLAEVNAFARVIDPRSCSVVSIPISGAVQVVAVAGGDIEYDVVASSAPSAPRAVVIQAKIRHVLPKTSSYGASPGYTECY